MVCLEPGRWWTQRYIHKSIKKEALKLCQSHCCFCLVLAEVEPVTWYHLDAERSWLILRWLQLQEHALLPRKLTAGGPENRPLWRGKLFVTIHLHDFGFQPWVFLGVYSKGNLHYFGEPSHVSIVFHSFDKVFKGFCPYQNESIVVCFERILFKQKSGVNFVLRPFSWTLQFSKLSLILHFNFYNPENWHFEPKNHPVESGKSSSIHLLLYASTCKFSGVYPILSWTSFRISVVPFSRLPGATKTCGETRQARCRRGRWDAELFFFGTYNGLSRGHLKLWFSKGIRPKILVDGSRYYLPYIWMVHIFYGIKCRPIYESISVC